MEKTPWLSLIPYDNNSKWWIASNNTYLPDSLSNSNQIVRAYYVMQDGNLHGSYYRYFYWLYGSNQRYFDVANKWYFDKPMSSMETGNIVVDTRTQQKYVVNDKFDNKFAKILEIAN